MTDVDFVSKIIRRTAFGRIRMDPGENGFDKWSVTTVELVFDFMEVGFVAMILY